MVFEHITQSFSRWLLQKLGELFSERVNFVCHTSIVSRDHHPGKYEVIRSRTRSRFDHNHRKFPSVSGGHSISLSSRIKLGFPIWFLTHDRRGPFL